MKYISLSIMLLCIHVSMAFVNAIGVFQPYLQPHKEWFDNIDENKIDSDSYTTTVVTSDYSVDLGDSIKSLFYFIGSFALGIVVVPYTLHEFGLDSPFIYIISLPVYLIYLLGIAQFIGNRSASSMT